MGVVSGGWNPQRLGWASRHDRPLGTGGRCTAPPGHGSGSGGRRCDRTAWTAARPGPGPHTSTKTTERRRRPHVHSQPHNRPDGNKNRSPGIKPHGLRAKAALESAIQQWNRVKIGYNEIGGGVSREKIWVAESGGDLRNGTRGAVAMSEAIVSYLMLPSR